MIRRSVDYRQDLTNQIRLCKFLVGDTPKGQTLLDNTMFKQHREVHKLTDLNQVDNCIESASLHLSGSNFEILSRFLLSWVLAKCQSSAKRDRCIEGFILTEHPLLQEACQLLFTCGMGCVEVCNKCIRKAGMTTRCGV